jgi:hypothetical protein
MKKLFAVLMAGVVLLGGSMVYAGGACCAGGDSAKADKAMGCSSDVMSKLNLTDDQKTKVAALKADCMKGGCNAESREKFTKGMKDILTADQYTQWQAACQKVTKGECPMHKSDSKS